MQNALALVGTPYRHHTDDNHLIGTTLETGFDCSGFVLYVLSQSGIEVPDTIRHAYELFDQFGVYVQRYRPGDLIFFSRTGRFPTHVGIVINENEYVEATSREEGIVKISPIIQSIPIESRYQNPIFTHNPIGFKSPTVQSKIRNRII